MGSPKFSLDGIDIKKTLIHLEIYLLGQLIVQVTPILSHIHLVLFNQDVSIIVGLIIGSILDIGRKFVQDNS